MKSLFFVSFAIVLSGCAQRPNHGYLPKDDDVFGPAHEMAYTQKRRMMVEAVEKLLTDPMFTTNYDQACKRAAAAGRARPTIALNPILNNADERPDAEVGGQIWRELETALRKTGKFDLINPLKRPDVTGTVIRLNETGGDPASLQSIGNYAASDFVMSGDINREVTHDGRRQVYHHFLNLHMTDTASGTVFWSDTMDTTKFEVR